MRTSTLLLLVGAPYLGSCAPPSIPEAPAAYRGEAVHAVAPPRCPIGEDSLLRVGELAMGLNEWRSTASRPPEALVPGQRILWDGHPYVWFGRPRALAEESAPGVQVRSIGSYRELPVYAESGSHPYGPEVLYLPAQCGCALQPFQRTACTRELRPGIEVRVLDARTGGPPAGGATLIAREGAYADTARIPRLPDAEGRNPHVVIGAAHERAGTYEVEIHSPGYRPWRIGDVAVREGVCHVATVGLTAYLEPLRE